MARKLIIRKATRQDAAPCSSVLCASIRALCSPDHHNDEALIAGWTANKTANHIIRWLNNSAVALFVAEIDSKIVGVGMIGNDGEILLNYVAPDQRFSGISRSMLRYLESELRKAGFSQARLTSTKTAHAFYSAADWQDDGEPEVAFGMIGYPMVKAL